MSVSPERPCTILVPIAALTRLKPAPKGFKVPEYGVPMVSVLGTVMLICGIYIIFRYSDPHGACSMKH